MEVVVAKALKPSLRGEFVLQQALCEEILSLNANSGVGGEDFSVDDLLDFSNGEFQLGSVGEGDEEVHYEEDDDEEEEKDSLSSSSLSQDRGGEDDSNSNSTDFSGAGDYEFFFGSDLTVQDEADLEWVSRFVDDSLPELSLMHPVGSEQSKSCVEPEPTVCSAKTPRFPSKIPVKARTTKSRKPKSRVWSVSPLLSRPSSPSSCSSVYSSPAPPVLVFVGSVPNADFSSGGSGEPPVKKQKKKAEEQTGGAQFQRRCSHCQSQKTPQWRTGPLGAKTLCNACGVRYKSGRLFAEYRPACSPTFSSDVHSNSHRKVLEIRKRKEMAPLAGSALAGSAQTQMVRSC